MRICEEKIVMNWCTARWKMLLFCVKTIVKESRKFELVCLKKMMIKKKTFWPSGNFLVWYFRDAFSATGCVVHHENTQR